MKKLITALLVLCAIFTIGQDFRIEPASAVAADAQAVQVDLPTPPTSPDQALDGDFLRAIGLHQAEPPVAVSCCKICRTGKACGNTCISRNKICRVGPGCACDG